ncbi:hypothetical protein J6590_072303, partial [Homalodisca vitripennis]
IHVAKKCGVSLGAVNKIMKQKETESVEVQRKEQCGRKLKTTPRDEAFPLRGSKFHPRNTSYDLHQDLEKNRIYIHDSTVRKRFLDGGKITVRAQRKQLLTEPMMKN